MHCSLCLFCISSLDKVFSNCFRHAFFHLGNKKVVAGRVRQMVVLHSNDCTGICLSGLSIGRLRRVVVLQRWSFEQIWLQCFQLIQNNLVCLMEKWVQIFECIISHSSAKSLVPPLHKFTIRNSWKVNSFPFFGKLNSLNIAVYLLTCQYFGRMEKTLSRRKVGLHFADFS